MSTRNILKSSLQNASFNIVFQIICRAVTFCINAFIVRSVGRDILGILNVRLLLLESTLIFLSREAISRASLSSTTQHKNKCTWPQLINQLWISVPICLTLSGPCLYIWINLLSPVHVEYLNAYTFGCYAIAFSCVIEMTAETPTFLVQKFCFVKVKVILDTAHIFIRSIVFISIVLSNKSIAIYAFGIAQFCSALTIIFGNYIFFYIYIKKLKAYRQRMDYKKIIDENLIIKNQQIDDDGDGMMGLTTSIEEAEEEENKMNIVKNSAFENMDDFNFNGIHEFFPCVLKNTGNYFNADLTILILSFAKQGVLKQILTEGEKYVMSVSPVLSFSEQATYDIVNNMGSLAARFIFRPIEDSSYFYFTQTISRDIKLKEQNMEKITEASTVLSNVCKVVTSIGLIGFVFGQSYSGTMLLLYGGADFVSGGLPEILLRWHSLAIVLLAVNGITEGYMFSTNTSKDIDKYNYFMAIFSIAFLLLSYQLTNIFGPVGFILANCTNMFFRISYSINYIYNEYKTVQMNPLKMCLPGKLFLATLFVMGIICKISEVRILKISILYHLSIGFVSVIIVIGSWLYENKDLLRLGLNKYRNKIKKDS